MLFGAVKVSWQVMTIVSAVLVSLRTEWRLQLGLGTVSSKYGIEIVTSPSFATNDNSMSPPFMQSENMDDLFTHFSIYVMV